MSLPPRVLRGQAEEIAAAHYGVSAVAQRPAAEHDDTFRLVTADGTTRLLKIAPGRRRRLAQAIFISVVTTSASSYRFRPLSCPFRPVLSPGK
jgi:Ser/Thr protein kinase RdoA (MazF antagonist)